MGCCEFICVIALPCPEDRISPHFFLPSGFCILSSPFSSVFPKPWRGQVLEIDVPFMAEHSAFYFSLLASCAALEWLLPTVNGSLFNSGSVIGISRIYFIFVTIFFSLEFHIWVYCIYIISTVLCQFLNFFPSLTFKFSTYLFIIIIIIHTYIHICLYNLLSSFSVAYMFMRLGLTTWYWITCWESSA